MRIKTVNISAFGGIKNKSFSFEDGFNVIFGDNENGKSTVMAFIKMMFYGTGGKRASSSLSKNLRKKYKPWDGSVMAGSIEFEHGGKSYRLERRFGDSDRTDEIFITDGFGNRKSGKSDIGCDYFGLSAAAFERSVFIGQLGAAEKDSEAEGELNQKLSNLFFSGDEGVSYESVKSRLEKSKYELTTPRKVGRLDKNLKRMEEIKSELENTKRDYEDYLRLKDDSVRLRGYISGRLKRLGQLKPVIDSEQDVRNAEKYKRLLEYKKQLDALNETLRLSDGSLADDSFVRSLDMRISVYEKSFSELENCRREENHLKEKIELVSGGRSGASSEKAAELENEISVLETELAAAQKQLENSKHQRLLLEKAVSVIPRKKINPVFIFLAAVLAAAAIVSFAVSLGIVPTAGAAAAAVLFLALAFVIRPEDSAAAAEQRSRLDSAKNTEQQAEDRVSMLERGAADKSGRLKEIKEALEISAEDTERLKNELERCGVRLKEISAKAETQKSDVLRLFEKYGTEQSLEEIKNLREEIKRKAEAQKDLKKDINRIRGDVGDISYEEAAEKLKNSGISAFETADFAAVKEEYESLSADISEKKAALAGISAQLDGYFRKEKSPESLKAELRELKDKTNLEEQFCKAADIAAEVLAQSFQELRGSYSAALEKKAGGIFGGITSGRYSGMKISNSFDISVEPDGEGIGRELEYLSSGTADQAYLSLRLALTEMISESGAELPVLLDDALAQYDDGRVKIAAEFLKQYAAKRQIVMFTCHRSVALAAENAGAHRIEF